MHNALLLRLTDGTYRVGDMLPPQRDLAKDLQVSRDVVQKVLKDLADEGFVKSVRGSGTRVVEPPTAKGTAADDAQERPTLYEYMGKAFREPEVSLDLVALTAETFIGHFRSQTELVTAGKIKPARVTVRMLLPSEDTDLEYPRALDPKDDRVRLRWRNRVRRHAAEMGDFCQELENAGVEVKLLIRRRPRTPEFKLILLNDTHALVGLYAPVVGPIRLDDGTIVSRAVDVKGAGVNLHLYERRGEGADDVSQFGDYREWFDSRWNLNT
ncbi:winged helix-turn-helix transcriptional regulator [Streptomyces sp. S3(2020)]|uniref:GntR family transcriptional regulator n=1 Tax=Streptomyces sp. S3(2020) TaxID=2732044 RepID=UPI0014892DD0|nr:winged helix-turn-helix transcriptional regulator [Streptomyces sp. S3(2020)]